MTARKPTKSTKPKSKKAVYYVHVSSATVKKNRLVAHNERQPMIIVRRGRSGPSSRAFCVEILDAQGEVAAVVEDIAHKPLSCGAVVVVRATYGARPARAGQSVLDGSDETG